MKSKASFLSPLCLALILIISSGCNSSVEKSKIIENKVTWFSLPSDSLDRAATFYKDAFNWKIEPLTKEDNDDFSFYTILNSVSDENYISKEKGAVNGCIIKRKIGLPTPAVLVEVDNLEEAIRKVKEAGGEIVSDKITMKSLNAVLVFIKDTEGNYVEVFQPLKN